MGITPSQTIKVDSYIKNQEVKMLIDSGSNHNFISFNMAKHSGLYIKNDRFNVTIANGISFKCID